VRSLESTHGHGTGTVVLDGCWTHARVGADIRPGQGVKSPAEPWLGRFPGYGPAHKNSHRRRSAQPRPDRNWTLSASRPQDRWTDRRRRRDRSAGATGSRARCSTAPRPCPAAAWRRALASLGTGEGHGPAGTLGTLGDPRHDQKRVRAFGFIPGHRPSSRSDRRVQARIGAARSCVNADPDHIELDPGRPVSAPCLRDDDHPASPPTRRARTAPSTCRRARDIDRTPHPGDHPDAPDDQPRARSHPGRHASRDAGRPD
jgi:hypothetical protein